MPRKLRVFLADDHSVLRDGLKLLIDAQADMEIIGEAGDGKSVLQQVCDCRPDVVVLDIAMPQLNGIQATEQIRQHCPEVKIVVLTRHNEAGYVRQLLNLGARGYVLKQAGGDELLSAIRAVASGGTYLDTTLTDRVVNQFMHAQAPGNEIQESNLSARELDVVRLTAHGYSNKEIGAQLGISAKTVDTYKTRAMEKLGLYSRAEIVRYALHCGWLDPN